MAAPSTTIPTEAISGCLTELTSDRSAASYNLFQEKWWLDAVAAGEWNEVSVKHGGEIVARLPYVHRKIAGRTFILQPRLTPYLGPWLRDSRAKLTNKLAEAKGLMQELILGLPKFDIFRQCFSPDVTNWLPFYWNGYSQSTRYTYRIADLSDPARLWANFRENIRREIRKAEGCVTVRDDADINYFSRVWKKTFVHQGMHMPVSMDVLNRIALACEKRSCGKVFVAEDGNGKPHAAAFIVWNADCAYYLLAGSDPGLRGSGAGSLVMWKAIEFASTVSRQFDFEGSMIEPIERFFRSFGGEQVPYLSISKFSRPMTFLAGLYHSSCALVGCQPLI